MKKNKALPYLAFGLPILLVGAYIVSKLNKDKKPKEPVVPPVPPIPPVPPVPPISTVAQDDARKAEAFRIKSALTLIGGISVYGIDIEAKNDTLITIDSTNRWNNVTTTTVKEYKKGDKESFSSGVEFAITTNGYIQLTPNYFTTKEVYKSLSPYAFIFKD